MSAQGGPLLVSPCCGSPSVGLLRDPRSHSVRVPITSQWTSPNPAAPGLTQTSLPSLSLRRRVLTNGRDPAEPGKRTSNYTDGPGHSMQVFGRPAGGDTLTKPPPFISSPPFYDPHPSHPPHPPPYPSSVPAPHSEARSLFSRESLASTTLSQFDTQSVFSGRHDWPYGYRVLPPLGAAPGVTQAPSEGCELVLHPPETSTSWGTTSTSASLPSYLFAVDLTSPKHSKKRSLSISPLSDVMGIDFNSLIRTSPTSLVAYINGARSSPSSSSVHSDAYGHFLGVRGSSIPQNQPGVLPTPVSELKAQQSHHVQLRRELENQMANMAVEQHGFSQQETGHNLASCQSMDVAVDAPIPDPGTPLGPPPPYHSHSHIYRPQQKQYPDFYTQSPYFRHGFLPQVPMLEEEEGEVEEHGGHLCRWMDCGGVYELKEELVRHIEKLHVDHRGAEDFACYWEGCPRRLRPFNARYKLLIHMRVHSGEKPNRCTFEGCKKAFSRLENLKIHLRSHTGEKPYVCPHPGCLKAFSNSSDRAKHQRTHQDIKPYACHVPCCEKRYTDPSSLRKHIKTHSAKEQQLRKKRRSAVDRGPDPLIDCLTIQALSPPMKRDTSLKPASASASPQGQTSAGDPHLLLLHSLQDNYRFIDQLFPGDAPSPYTSPHPPPLHNTQSPCLNPELTKNMNLSVCASHYGRAQV